MVRALIRERLLEAAWRWTPPSRFLAGMRKLAKSLPGRYPRGQSTTGQSPDFAGRADLLFIYWLSVLPVTDRFPIRKEERDAAEAIAEFGTLRTKLKPRLKPSAVYQVLRGVPEPALAVLAALETKAVSASIRAFLDGYSKVRIATTGADLRGAGLKPGPAFREILDELLFARLDGRIRSVTEERALLQQLARQKVG
jgi:hypothetical protein